MVVGLIKIDVGDKVTGRDDVVNERVSIPPKERLKPRELNQQRNAEVVLV